MTRHFTLAALLAALPLSATPAAAQTGYAWRVLSVFPTVMTMVGDPVQGPPNLRVVPTLVVLDKRDNQGVDYEIAWYDVNCEEETIRNHSNILYGEKTRPTKSLTHDAFEPYTKDAYFNSIATYACTGERESDDDSRFTTDRDAFVYGRQLAAAATAEEGK